jgi:hypothetical protein
MEEILSFFGFSVGASLGVSAVRALGDGSRPVVREVFKAGIRAWDGLAGAGAAARENLANVQAETRAEPQTRARRGRQTQAQKIIVARE